MYCKKCGKPLPENAVFCPFCGDRIESVRGNSAENDQRPVNKHEHTAYDHMTAAPMAQKKMGGWFSFITNVQLILGPILWIAEALIFFTGNQYQMDGKNVAQQVYSGLPGLQILDYAYGTTCIAIAISGFAVRALLRKRDIKAIQKYAVFAALNIGSTVIYLLVTSLLLGQFSGDENFIAQLVAQFILICINLNYLKKRKPCFEEIRPTARIVAYIGDGIAVIMMSVCFLSLAV